MIDVVPLERTSPQARLDSVVIAMIRAHVGKPCPTRREIGLLTGIPRRKVWEFLTDAQKRGLIEIEADGEKDPIRRRMRVRQEAWTDWTARTKRDAPAPKPALPTDLQIRLAIDKICRMSGAIYDAPSVSEVQDMFDEYGLAIVKKTARNTTSL